MNIEIAAAEALPILARARALRDLRDVHAELAWDPAGDAAVLRALPEAEALPATERARALRDLLWASSHNSPAEEAVEAARRGTPA